MNCCDENGRQLTHEELENYTGLLNLTYTADGRLKAVALIGGWRRHITNIVQETDGTVNYHGKCGGVDHKGNVIERNPKEAAIIEQLVKEKMLNDREKIQQDTKQKEQINIYE